MQQDAQQPSTSKAADDEVQVLAAKPAKAREPAKIKKRKNTASSSDSSDTDSEPEKKKKAEKKAEEVKPAEKKD